MKKTLILAFAVTILTSFSGKYLHAQTKEDAGNAFNAALELSKTDMTGAVTKMQEVIKMCATVGKDADSLKMKCTTVLPVWQYNVGNNFLKEKKYDQAIIAFEKSNELALTYSDDNIKEKSQSILSKLYVNNGNNLVKTLKYDDAISYFEKALKFDPEYSKAYYANALAYKKKGDNVKMQENMDKAISCATKENDTLTINAAKNAVATSLYQDGAAAFKKKAFGEAVEKLNNSLAYDKNNKEVYYLLAVSNNNLKNYDESVVAANNGVTLEEQTSIKLARFYYEIAKAYEGKLDTKNACENYKKAAVGTFKASAEYQMKTVLKCQ